MCVYIYIYIYIIKTVTLGTIGEPSSPKALNATKTVVPSGASGERPVPMARAAPVFAGKCLLASGGGGGGGVV